MGVVYISTIYTHVYREKEPSMRTGLTFQVQLQSTIESGVGSCMSPFPSPLFEAINNGCGLSKWVCPPPHS
jgi:hypothetical protein